MIVLFIYYLPNIKLIVEQAGVFLNTLNGKIENPASLFLSLLVIPLSPLAVSGKGVESKLIPLLIKNDTRFILDIELPVTKLL